MIIEVNKNNISILDDSFLDSEYITNELNMNPFAKIYVYVENNKVVGYIYYSDIYERVEINQIEVENIHRNCGLGTKLLKFVTGNVDKTISLEVKIDNYPAIKLYKKFDFVPKATRKGYYNGIDGILMVRDIK